MALILHWEEEVLGPGKETSNNEEQERMNQPRFLP